MVGEGGAGAGSVARDDGACEVKDGVVSAEDTVVGLIFGEGSTAADWDVLDEGAGGAEDDAVCGTGDGGGCGAAYCAGAGRVLDEDPSGGSARAGGSVAWTLRSFEEPSAAVPSMRDGGISFVLDPICNLDI